ncbi:MAG: tetratricopeptide repeat protein [Saprospiraceae bacterium]
MLKKKASYLTIIFFILLTSSILVNAQSNNIDSLLILLKNEQSDTAKISRTLHIANLLFSKDQGQTIQLLQDLNPILPQATKHQQLNRLHYLGASYQYLGKLDSLEYFNNSILSQITKEEDEKIYARALANIGTAYRAKGDLEKATEVLEEALLVFDTQKNDGPKGSIRNGLGLIYQTRGDYQSAMKVFLEAQGYFEKMGHEVGQAIIINNIGRVYHDQKNYDNAITNYKEYLRRSKKIGKENSIANAMNNIGVVFMDAGKLDSALFYLEKSIEKKEELDIRSTLSTSLNNIGKISNLNGNYQEAIEFNTQALALAREFENKKDQAYILQELATSYKNLNDNITAKSFFQQALDLAESMGDVQLQYNSNEGLYEILKTKNSEKALKHLAVAYVLKDSILNIQNTEALTTMRLENDFEKRELVTQQTITTLELQEELQSTRLSNQRNIIIGLVVALGLLGFLLFQIFRQKNKIEDQNQVIQKSLKEKDTLLREIHHRVKNNLQVISSLLSIQSRNLTDQAAVDALNEGRSRVQTMSLIHQDLYQQDQLTGINFQKYFKQLIQNLFSTYNISEENIEIVAEIDDLNLDVDTVIPIGLILNELITNALKYAFNGGEGKIHVILKEEKNTLLLEVKDNGIGIQKMENISENNSYGFELIHALVDKLDGELNISNEDGTQVRAVFKTYQKAA